MLNLLFAGLAGYVAVVMAYQALRDREVNRDKGPVDLAYVKPFHEVIRGMRDSHDLRHAKKVGENTQGEDIYQLQNGERFRIQRGMKPEDVF